MNFQKARLAALQKHIEIKDSWEKPLKAMFPGKSLDEIEAENDHYSLDVFCIRHSRRMIDKWVQRIRRAVV